MVIDKIIGIRVSSLEALFLFLPLPIAPDFKRVLSGLCSVGGSPESNMDTLLLI
jgi:hypothetical protein